MASLKQAYQQDTEAEEIEMISDDTLFTVTILNLLKIKSR